MTAHQPNPNPNPHPNPNPSPNRPELGEALLRASGAAEPDPNTLQEIRAMIEDQKQLQLRNGRHAAAAWIVTALTMGLASMAVGQVAYLVLPLCSAVSVILTVRWLLSMRWGGNMRNRELLLQLTEEVRSLREERNGA